MEQEPENGIPNESHRIAAALRDSGIETEICDEIAGMDPADAYRIAYDTLDLAGQNADAILARFMEEPES